jgi:predicted dehydrogenase
MRFGLVGTGPWARMTHGPGLIASTGIELAGVWGRSTQDAERLASELGAIPNRDYSAMLDDVEAVAFAVPPDVQAVMATEAARAGKHLLLDKPIAIDLDAARTLQAAVDSSKVATVVFFTDRFDENTRTWLDGLHRSGGWRGGWMRWFSALQEPDNPFGASPWRRRRGALWDTGPHALSTLGAALGPIDSITAVPGRDDLITLTLTHRSGVTSTATLSQFAPPAAACVETTVWGQQGFSTMPARPEDPTVALRVAAQELVESARSGRPHDVDVAFGARVVELLTDAQAQVDRQRDRGPLAPR